jgi:hypothetical protein
MSYLGTDGTHTSDPLSLKVVPDELLRGAVLRVCLGGDRVTAIKTT